MEIVAELTANESQALIAGGILGFTYSMIIMFSLLFYVITVIATWRIFKKANEPGWKALIPIYNIYIMFKIAKMKNWFWWIILSTIALLVVMFFDKTLEIFTMDEASLSNYNWDLHLSTVVMIAITCTVYFWTEIVYAWRTSKVFGHGLPFAIGLFFFQPIFWLILAFDHSKYDKKNLRRNHKKD